MSIDIAAGFLLSVFLVFCRVGALAMTLPGIGQSGVPARVRLSLALLLALVLTPVIAGQETLAALVQLGGTAVLISAIQEVVTGLAMGLVVRMVLTATSMAGTVISNQMGLGLALAVDPTQGIQGALFANFLGVLAATLVFSLDLHHLAVIAMRDSYALFPLGMNAMAGAGAGDWAQLATEALAAAFGIGLQMSAPFLVFGLAFYVGLGVLNRLMPQIQIFFIAMPASILLGIALFAVVLAAMMAPYEAHLTETLRSFIRP